MQGRWARRAVVAVVGAMVLAAATLPAAAQTGEPAPPAEPLPAPIEVAGVQAAADGAVPGEYIVEVAPEVPDGAVEDVAEALATDADAEVQDTFTRAIDGFVLEGASEADAAALLDDPRVVAVHENGRVSLGAEQRTTNLFTDPTLNVWGLDRISEPYLPLDGWYRYPDAAGVGVEVYVLDTGIRATHGEFGGRATAAFDAGPNGSNTAGADCHGHGTHVAGTLGGSLMGVAKAATITSVRVLDCNGDGTDASVIAGLEYAIADHTSGPAVANLSIGGGPSTPLDQAVQAAIADGITVVVAAGNENVDACGGSPARAANAITVGSTTVNDARSSFSNWGTCVDLFAPGSAIVSSWYTSDSAYAILGGTSMASPHVAGAAALHLQANPTATPAQVWAALQTSAVEGVLTGLGTGSPNHLLYTNTTLLTDASAPTGVTATPGDQQVAVSWSAPASNGGSAVRWYQVLRNGVQVHQTTNGSTTAWTDTGRTNGVSYSYVVRAVTAVGAGASSAPVSATPRTVPGAPTGVSATPGDTTVQVAWSAPASNGGSAITAYQVLRGGDLVHTTANGSTLSWTDTGRTNGVSYSYVVRAVNVAGAGAASSPAVSATPRTVPGAPTGVSATPGDTTVQVAWSAPASNGGSAITAYQVLRGGDLVHTTANGSTLSWTDTGRTNGVSSSYVVRAVNVAGAGAASSPAVSATPRTVPGAPTGVSATPGDTTVQVAWSAPASNGGSAITAYQVLRGGDLVHTTANGSTLSWTDTGRTNGVSSSYVVRAVNVAGAGAASSPAVSATPRTVPGAPRDVTATAGNTSLQVSWSAPSSNGGAALTGYRLYVEGELVQSPPPGATSALVTGLTNGVAHDVELSAVNVAGEGSRAATTGTPAAVPSAPSGVSVVPGDRQVTLTWGAPEDDGGSDVEGYEVLRDGSVVHTTEDASTTSWTNTDLTNGTSYGFQVRALNPVGPGLPSQVVTATPVAPPPAAPTFVDVPSTHPFYLDVEWMAANQISTGYQPGPRYRPADAVTRQAMSAFMFRLAGSPAFSPPGDATFGDVRSTHPFFVEIEWMASEGITNGSAASPKPLYKPGDPVTRQAMSAFMFRLAGSPAFSPPGDTTFGDVAPSHPFFAEVEWMASEGITNGTAASPKPLYKPGDPVSRGAMSAFMHRLADGPGVDL